MTDLDNIARSFREGNEKAFKGVFRLLYTPLCCYGKKFAIDDNAIEEIVDDCFIRVWKKRTLFFDYSSLKAYLFKSVRNACMTWLTRRKPDVTEFLPLNHDTRAIEINQDSFAEIEASFIEMLPKLLLTLSDQQKTIIKQIFFDGKNTKEVADSLTVSASTVKTQKARTLAKLKKALKQSRQ